MRVGVGVCEKLSGWGQVGKEVGEKKVLGEGVGMGACVCVGVCVGVLVRSCVRV